MYNLLADAIRFIAIKLGVTSMYLISFRGYRLDGSQQIGSIYMKFVPWINAAEMQLLRKKLVEMEPNGIKLQPDFVITSIHRIADNGEYA